ncbi:hypothetical protein Tsubulata_020155 [Turnera subulata]|uniref:Endonuclease/exonuclease/phosphatase domain-containing protein n=1 Tax=Turnera subulata TaxID=218843 RepID=A0A9Q0G573_9ROSI|nr:hypothetical protein Tsubulata_020155 [Turnera subulata]
MPARVSEASMMEVSQARPSTTVNLVEKGGASFGVASSKYGQWILVPPKSRNFPKKGVQNQKDARQEGSKGLPHGSRFSALDGVKEQTSSMMVDPKHPDTVGQVKKGASKGGSHSGLEASHVTSGARAKNGKFRAPPAASKGIFIVHSTTELAASGAPVTKRARGHTGYNLTGEDLAKAVTDGSRKNVKPKKGKEKVGEGVSPVDKWSGVLAGSVPVPVAFQVTKTIQDGLVPATTANAFPAAVGGHQPTSTSMEMAFDPRGPKILACNCQGARSDRFRRAFWDLVVSHRPNVVILVEPQVQFSVAQRTLQNYGFDGFEVVEATGRSGGVWICWRRHLLTVTFLLLHEQFLHVTVQFPASAPWFLTAVYASPTPSVRQVLWQELRRVAGEMHGSWLIIGDFNTYVDQSEKLGGAPACETRYARFSSWIYDCQLLDLGFHGSPFTWERRAGVRREYVAERPSLNHPKPFQFQATWLLDSRFQQVVEMAWRGDLPFLDSSRVLQARLSKWNWEVFGNIFHRKKVLLARISGIQRLKATARAGYFLHSLEKELLVEYDRVLAQEEMLWFQKSRSQWVQNGDRNTSFFHTSTLIR